MGLGHRPRRGPGPRPRPSGRRLPGPRHPGRAQLRFSARVPGDRPVTVRVTHPILTAAPDGGSATVTAAGIQRGSQARARSRGDVPLVDDLERDDAKNQERGIACCCSRASPRANRSSVLTPRFDHGVGRFGGYAPGELHDLDGSWAGAPIVLEDIELGRAIKDLGDLGSREGATLKATVVVGEGQDFPRVDVSAASLGKPAYSRRASARGKSEFLVARARARPLQGLGQRGDGGSAPREQEVTPPAPARSRSRSDSEMTGAATPASSAGRAPRRAGCRRS